MKNRLREKRIASGYKTASIFCKENNLPVSTYISHENGTRPINIKHATQYAKILNCLINDISDISILQKNEAKTFAAFLLGKISSENKINLNEDDINAITQSACKIYQKIENKIQSSSFLLKIEHCVNTALSERLKHKNS